MNEPTGYDGRGADHPRKYVKGPLSKAYVRSVARNPETEYQSTCELLGASQNSNILARLSSREAPIPRSKLLCGTAPNQQKISLHDTYLGERGFIALLPFLDMNTKWTELDASNNGLRNEAVLHLVDLLMQPQHANRCIRLDLSRNPISDTAALALMELVNKRMGIQEINLAMTKVQRRTIARLRGLVARRLAEYQAFLAEQEPFNNPDSPRAMSMAGYSQWGSVPNTPSAGGGMLDERRPDPLQLFPEVPEDSSPSKDPVSPADAGSRDEAPSAEQVQASESHPEPALAEAAPNEAAPTEGATTQAAPVEAGPMADTETVQVEVSGDATAAITPTPDSASTVQTGEPRPTPASAASPRNVAASENSAPPES